MVVRRYTSQELVVRQRHTCRVLVVGRGGRLDSIVSAWTALGEEVVGLRVCRRICRFALSAGERVRRDLANWIVTIDLARMCEVRMGNCMPMSKTAMVGAVRVSDVRSIDC